MSYILMATQETGEEIRVEGFFETWAEADGQIDNVMDEHPEWRDVWIEQIGGLYP